MADELLGGRFRLGGELARGGFGAVFAARDELAGDEVVVKLLLRAPDARGLARFLREGELAQRLQHPAIVPLRACGTTPAGQPFLAYTRVEGGEPLDKAWRTWGARARVAGLVRVAEALGAAHREGVVHRDVKPANILVDPAGDPHLIDFGIALERDAERLTQTGGMVGTPGYMAPEQLSGAREQGPPADVWALGVLLYQALAEQLPFDASTSAELIGAILAGDPEPLPPAGRRALPGAQEVISRALARDPALRYPDGAAMAAALRELVAGGGRRGPRPRLVLAAALLLGLGLIGAAGALRARRAGGEQDLDASLSPSQGPALAPSASPGATSPTGAAQRARRALLRGLEQGAPPVVAAALREQDLRPWLGEVIPAQVARVRADLARADAALGRALRCLGLLRAAAGVARAPDPLADEVFAALELRWSVGATGPAVELLAALGASGLRLTTPRRLTALPQEIVTARHADSLDEAQFASALLAFVRLDLELSRDYFDRTFQLPAGEPEAEFVRLCMAVSADRSGAAPDALRAYLARPEAEALLGPVHRARALVSCVRGTPDRPDDLALIEEALRLDPLTPYAQVLLGERALARGERAAALAAAEAALRGLEEGDYEGRGWRQTLRYTCQDTMVLFAACGERDKALDLRDRARDLGGETRDLEARLAAALGRGQAPERQAPQK
ncbi:MAG: serine/threonine-protein kinase [Planctomycetota bacterium]